MLATPLPRPSGRVEFEQGLSYAPRVTLMLIAMNLIVFGWEALSGVALSPGPSVGASGAIFGLMAAVAAFLHHHDQLFRIRDKRIFGVLLAWAAYTIVTGFATPYVDNAAHVGGFIGGWLMGRG